MTVSMGHGWEEPVDDILLTIRNEKLKPGEELRGAKRVKMKQGPRDRPWANLASVEGKTPVRGRASEQWKNPEHHYPEAKSLKLYERS